MKFLFIQLKGKKLDEVAHLQPGLTGSKQRCTNGRCTKDLPTYRTLKSSTNRKQTNRVRPWSSQVDGEIQSRFKLRGTPSIRSTCAGDPTPSCKLVRVDGKEIGIVDRCQNYTWYTCRFTACGSGLETGADEERTRQGVSHLAVRGTSGHRHHPWLFHLSNPNSHDLLSRSLTTPL
jgi:hypothetical protein